MQYIINKEKQMVVAIMNNTENDAIDFLWANYRNSTPFLQLIEDGHKDDKTLNESKFDFIYDSLDSLKIKHYYVGKAKIHGDDIFDVETGKKIAAAKAKYKHDKAMQKTIDKVLKAELERINNAIAKIQFKFMKSTDDIIALENL